MRKVLVILRKEWLELRQERGLLAGIFLPPLLLTLLPVAVVYGMGVAPDEELERMGAVLVDPALSRLAGAEQAQAMIGKQFGTLFLLMPLIVPSVIAAYSIVGEKTRRTLEPLLASPISTSELLIGKSLAALLPALMITWVCGAIYVAGIALISLSSAVFAAIVSPAWVLLLLLLSPLVAMITIALSVAISSRVNDPRSAQQIAGVLVVPIMAAMGAQLAGLVVLSPAIILVVALVLLLVVAGSFALATRLFQREVILTRWK